MEKKYFCRKASELSIAELHIPYKLEEIIMKYHVNLEELVMFCRLDIAQNKRMDMLDFLERYHYVDSSTIPMDNDLRDYSLSIISEELERLGYVRPELRSALRREDYFLKNYANGEALVPLLLNYKDISGYKLGNERYETYNVMTAATMDQILNSLKNRMSSLQLDAMRMDLEYHGMYKLTATELELLSFARRNCNKFLANYIIDSILAS